VEKILLSDSTISTLIKSRRLLVLIQREHGTHTVTVLVQYEDLVILTASG
jgi:hypothetical protein